MRGFFSGLFACIALLSIFVLLTGLANWLAARLTLWQIIAIGVIATLGCAFAESAFAGGDEDEK